MNSGPWGEVWNRSLTGTKWDCYTLDRYALSQYSCFMHQRNLFGYCLHSCDQSYFTQLWQVWICISDCGSSSCICLEETGNHLQTEWEKFDGSACRPRESKLGGSMQITWKSMDVIYRRIWEGKRFLTDNVREIGRLLRDNDRYWSITCGYRSEDRFKFNVREIGR
jgi:hypothetical protein